MSVNRASSSRYHQVDESYDGHEYGDELEELDLTEARQSRAPSYTSIDANTFWDGIDDDNKGLVQHARALSGDQDSIDTSAPLRADTRLSITSTLRSQKKRKLSGWHFGVRVCAWTATFVGCMNIILLIAGAAKFPIDDGIGTAYEGSCKVVDHWTTWLHILINGLSSLLLSASNYTMQALSAPTRGEIDRAHAKGDWMDIGVASIRNLSRIKWLRVVLWWVLACSSVPIHLLYNSAVFKTIDSNEYMMVLANPAWLDGGNFSTEIPWTGAPAQTETLYNYGYNVSMPYDNTTLPDLQKWWAENYQNETLVERLNNTKCIQAYSTNFVTGRNHVLVITSENGTQVNETLFMFEDTAYYYDTLSYEWICQNDYNATLTSASRCDPGSVKKHSDNWIINGKKVDYCLSQVLPSHCELQFSVQVLVAVIVMNILKSVAMFITLYKQKDVTLVTVGDAITSYLDEPDELTKGRCLMSRKDIKGWKLNPTEKKPNTNPLPITYYPPKTQFWFRAASKGRWITTFTLIILAIIITGSLLGLGMDSLESSAAEPFKIGFGSIDSRALISAGLPQNGANGLISSILLANLPQAICSFLYLLYNSLMTSLLLAKEWSQYALRRKPLRVTHPHGNQRSTYYLQLPLRYSAPLLLISATLHWVISQSIFLARINTYYNGEPSDSDDVSQVGYSCPPILVAMLFGIVLLLGALAMGFRKFTSPMPIVSSCSVAIAAACHRPKDDPDAAYLSVQWGEIASMENSETGHCAFTSGPVDPVVTGRMYAGGGDAVWEIRRRQKVYDRSEHGPGDVS